MGVVLLSTPCSRISPSAAAPIRLTTESRVQHKAVKLMTKRRPKKVSFPQHIDHLVDVLDIPSDGVHVVSFWQKQPTLLHR